MCAMKGGLIKSVCCIILESPIGEASKCALPQLGLGRFGCYISPVFSRQRDLISCLEYRNMSHAIAQQSMHGQLIPKRLVP